MSSVPELFVEM